MFVSLQNRRVCHQVRNTQTNVLLEPLRLWPELKKDQTNRNKALILAVVAEDHLDKNLNYPQIKITISILFLSLSPFKYLYLEIYVF